MKIKSVKPKTLKLKKQKAYDFFNLRGSDYILNTDLFARHAFCISSGTLSSIGFTSITTASNATFVNCPNPGTGQPFVLRFRTFARATVFFIFSSLLTIDYAGGNSIQVALYLDDVQKRPLVESGGTGYTGQDYITIHMVEEVDAGEHTFTFKGSFSGVSSAFFQNAKLAISSQYLTKL